MRHLAVVVPLLLSIAGCTQKQAAPPRAASTYVNPKLCAGCHASQWETYRQTGMGRSFYRPAQANMVEDFASGSSFYHAASGRYYQMLQRGGQYVIRRYQKGAAGVETNVMEASIDYVMGSGNHARSYIHRTAQNRLVQLPVTWYPEKKGTFAMSPGYDRADHLDFRRKIGYDCFFCHNAYPDVPAGRDTAESDPVYPAQLPEGIDCQRCHGPGSAHVAAAQQQRPTAEVRQAILNPAHLARDRQLELCMQCHLETTSFVLPASIQRYGRGMFSYRPGEPLGDYMLHFDHAPGKGRDDKFEIVSAAYRLRQSTCFQKSAGALVCTTCHNPHRALRGELALQQYAAACQRCHQAKLQELVASGRHSADGNCVGCHMAKRRTEDVVHAVMTDHRILRRQPARDLVAPLAERHEVEGVSYRGEVALYYPASLAASPDRVLYVAVAQVAQRSNLGPGIPQLEVALRTHAPARPEFYMAMAQALVSAGRRDDAVAMYQTALQHDPKSLLALRGLGTALAKGGDFTRAIPVLEQARSIDPQDAATLHELGLAYRDAVRPVDAVTALREAVRLDPDLPEIHNSLGNVLLETGERDQAEQSLREAIRIQPDFSEAHANLGNALAAAGNGSDAEREYHEAVRLDPSNASAHYGYGAALASRGRFDEAQKQIEEAVRLAPSFAEALSILGDLFSQKNQWSQAMVQYQAALRSKPQFGRAHLGLGAAMAATHDLSGAREHLTIAAQDANPAVRGEAQDLLGQLPK